MAKQPPPAQVPKKVTASTVAAPIAAATNAKYEHVVHLGANGDYTDEVVLIQGATK